MFPCFNDLSIVYLYYADEKCDEVFAAITDLVISEKPKSFMTENGYLFDRVRESLYFPKNEEENMSLSLPDNKQYLANFTLQLGEGDSFA